MGDVWWQTLLSMFIGVVTTAMFEAERRSRLIIQSKQLSLVAPRLSDNQHRRRQTSAKMAVRAAASFLCRPHTEDGATGGEGETDEAAASSGEWSRIENEDDRDGAAPPLICSHLCVCRM